MNFHYSPITRLSKKIFRTFFPVQKSSYTLGEVEDICAINLVPPEDLKIFFTNCVEMLRKIKGDDVGDYLEFGVFNGSSLGSMYLAAKNLELGSVQYFGFDAYEGLPAGAEKEDDGVWKKGFYTCSFEKMKQCLRRKKIDPNDITWVNGWYNKTLNDEKREELELKNISIVFIDCDTYSSSKSVLEFIYPLMNQPMILCFDDWKLNDLDIKGMGEYKAFNELLEAHPEIRVKEIKSYNRKSKSFLVTP